MIRKRPSAMQLLLPLLALTSGMSLAQAMKAEHRAAAVDSSAILESVLCVVRSNPMQCIRQQAGRVLDNWEDILEIKKREMMEEADKENQRRSEQRGLSGDDGKQTKQSPSNLILQIEDGLSTISDFVSDGVDSYADTGKTGKSAEEGQPKKHLHHILHKLGNAGGNGTNEGLARRDLEDDVTALEDGWVNYGLGAGPEKAIGRGKQEGDQHVVYGGVEAHSSSGGGFDSEEKEDEQETGRLDSGEGGFGGFRRKRKGKKKKTFMKLFILGAALKGKIELLLKILSFHLQLKFFAIAAIGLLINIARFWIDLKKQPHPQKVIYYEHAQHQHHYDDHNDGDYGGYWKRSLHAGHEDDSTGFFDRSDRVDEDYSRGVYPQPHPHYVPQQTPNSPSHYPYDPHSIAYQQQRPYV
ncbi:uncharacterized protein LOC134210176 isoform X2 [Armigeres subalbatus]|uniref:uncharacterized protein LOC134210176 isoform X2 n=1 Tax=Armigeres subalbatus TaxID=124917 RepID=UPI002ED00D7A